MSDLPFYRFEIAENLTTKPQCYPSFNLMFLLDGAATVQIEGQFFSLKPHDFIFFNVYELHQFVLLAPDTRFLLIMIHEHYLQIAAPEFLSCRLHTHIVTADADSNQYHYFCREYGKFIYHHTFHSSGNQLQCLTHLNNLFFYILNHFGNTSSDFPERQNEEHLYHALSYISEHYTTELTLPLVAEQVGIHPQYFSKYFKQKMGMTLTEYINQIRIVSSLSDIINTDHSLLDIALAHGFNNYKTYSTAFKKEFHTSPHTWKKEQLLIHEHQCSSPDSSSVFSFFRNYWKEGELSPATSIQTDESRITLELDGTSARKVSSIFRQQNSTRHPVKNSILRLPEFCYSIGRAADLLRGDIQQQIRIAAEELPIHWLRLRNIFSDDLFVYYETPERNAIYNWQYIDMVYDFLISLKIRPYTELGFMPRMLASKQQFANWQHRPNVSFPRSLKNWSRLVEHFLRHLIQRYGEDEVLTWKFNVWTSPDLDIRGGYWHESMESFFLFYRVTYNAVKSVHEKLLFGGADFSIPNGFDWYQAYFNYCRQYEIKPDFLTVHLYAETFDTEDRMKSNRYLLGTLKQSHTVQIRLYQSLFDFLDLVNKDETFHDYPIIISDWNNTFHSKDYSRDTCFMSSFIAYTFQLLAGTQIQTLGFRSLCDVNEDFFPENRLFCGGPGLMDIHGLKKASYYTFLQLNQLGPEILEKGENYLFARQEDRYQLLLFHAAFPTARDETIPSTPTYEQRYDCYGNVPPLSVCVILNVASGHYMLRQTEVSRTSGSAYDLWVQMGSPRYDSAEILEYIQSKSIPNCYYSEASVTDHLLVNVDLPMHSVILIEIFKTE